MIRIQAVIAALLWAMPLLTVGVLLWLLRHFFDRIGGGTE